MEKEKNSTQQIALLAFHVNILNSRKIVGDSFYQRPFLFLKNDFPHRNSQTNKKTDKKKSASVVMKYENVCCLI